MLDQLKPEAVVIAVPLESAFSDRHGMPGGRLRCLSGKDDVPHDRRGRSNWPAGWRESKRVFQIGLQRRANPIYKQAQAMIEAGMIGHVTAIKAQWHRNNNWRRPIPRPKTDAGGRLWNAVELAAVPRTSGGLMAELGSHQARRRQLVARRLPSGSATGGIDYWRDGREVFDNIFCTYEYELPARIAKEPSARPPHACASPIRRWATMPTKGHRS